jgi:hypothetical protein
MKSRGFSWPIFDPLGWSPYSFVMSRQIQVDYQHPIAQKSFLFVILPGYRPSRHRKEYIQMKSVRISLRNSLIPARNREFFCCCFEHEQHQNYTNNECECDYRCLL